MDGEEEKNLFFNEMHRFNDQTVEKIEKILQEDKYDLMVEVLGLTSIVSALILTYGRNDEEKEQFFETVKFMLEQHQNKFNKTVEE